MPFETAQMCLRQDGAIVGNPISPATGEKVQQEEDIASPGPLDLGFSRIHRSLWANNVANESFIRRNSPLSKSWSHNHLIKLDVVAAAYGAMTLVSGEGYATYFTKTADPAVWNAAGSAGKLTRSGSNWVYRRAEDNATLAFDANGDIVSETRRNGWVTSYTYFGPGKLASVSNSFGRRLNLTYAGNADLATVTTQDGRSASFAYDGSRRLVRATYSDGRARTYLYENAAFIHALTGIVDESGTRLATFTYDEQGRAIRTEHAGGVQRYEVGYPSPGGATRVTDPLGTQRLYSYSTSGNRLSVSSSNLPPADGAAGTVSRNLTADGLVDWDYDFKYTRTLYAWDTARRLPTSVTEAAGTAIARTTTRQWHPSFSLPAQVTEAGRRTAYTYDAQGNVLSKAVTDTAASPQTTRTWRWTYTPQALVATSTEPTGAVTTYAYDSYGNARTVTNALGHVTSYTYDGAHRVSSQTEPNGLVTAYAWDARDRMTSVSTGPASGARQTTTLAYNPTGTLASLTLPTGLRLAYSYDAAQRLVGWSNNRGESGAYTLDGMGNRKTEQVKNAAGVVAYTVARTINSINRVASETQGSNQTSYGYDNNGERISETNAASQTTQVALDELRRAKTVTDAANAYAQLEHNPLDDLTKVKDFKGVTTAYTRNEAGGATAETGPDAGARSTFYDSLGLPRRLVDALGQATDITRDALGRPTALRYADGRSTTLTWDSTAAGKGYLAGFADRSGNTTYQRDLYGRVTRKTQTLNNGSVQQLGYSYTPAGLVDTVTYPGGNQLKHVYDATGRLTRLDANGQPFVTGITWNPLGQPLGWTWAFVGTSPQPTARRSYDTAGRVTATEFSSYVYDTAGRISRLTQHQYKPADANPQNTTITSADKSWDVTYDRTGRLTGFAAVGASPADTASYTYDANGNRLTQSRSVNGVTTPRAYTVVNNRLVDQRTAGGGTVTASYAYNANGDLLTDGQRQYAYDAEGRLAAVTTGSGSNAVTTRYAHNALGQRVFKTEPLHPPVSTGPVGTTPADRYGYAYTYDEDGNLLAETGMGGAFSSGSTLYAWLPTPAGPLPIAALINGVPYAVHSDHLNTPRRATAPDGRVAWQWGYSAFGDEAPTIAAQRFTGPGTNPTSGATVAPALTFNLRYPGQYFDRESGLFYNYFRSYDPGTGRYTQSDPIGLAGGLNTFAYVDGDPVNWVDPDGLTRQRGGGNPRTAVSTSGNQSGGWSYGQFYPRLGEPLPPSRNASYPVGSSRSPIRMPNSPQQLGGEVCGRNYSGHAFDQMQGRGIMPSVVNNTVATGNWSLGRQASTSTYYDPVNNVTVVVNHNTGKTVTVHWGPPSGK